MIHYTKAQIEGLQKLERLILINGISGIKPANLIGSISNRGVTNLAIFSSIIHLGSNPALLGFIMRPDGVVRRDTLENIKENNFFTINHVNSKFIEKAHYTSAKFQSSESEFEKCKLTEEFLYDFKAPFVKESKLKMGMKWLESIPIKANNTILIIGQVQHLIIDEKAISSNGQIDLSTIDGVGISGLNSYYSLNKIAEFPYARTEELPNFK